VHIILACEPDRRRLTKGEGWSPPSKSATGKESRLRAAHDGHPQ
jgi:hypothetical protein